jgi:mitochondrial fission protein ELM1
VAVNSEKTVWVLNDGRAGHYRQARALAAYLPATTMELRFRLKAPWRLFAPRSLPFGLIMHPRILSAMPAKKPDAIISCGRQSALLALWLQGKRGPGSRIVQILDCGLPPERFNFLIAPIHDGCTGPNVIRSLGSLNPVDASWLNKAAEACGEFHRLARPRVVALLGGPSRHFEFSMPWLSGRLAELRARVASCQGSLIIVASPRTPGWVEAIARAPGAGISPEWVCCEQEPSAESERLYSGAIAHADYLVVTADSVNLVSEACGSGKPVWLMGQRQVKGRVGRFCQRMIDETYVRPLGEQAFGDAPPVACLRETELIAKHLLESDLFS